MKSIKIIQEHLPNLIKVAFLPAPTELGRFTVKTLEETLPKAKKELNIDFDKVKIYPGPQPRETGDIELYKDGKLVKRISVKTAVTGDLKIALRKLWTDLVKGLDGIIIAFAYAKVSEDEDLAKLLVIYLPAEVVKYGQRDVLDEIEMLIDERARTEGYQYIRVFAVNEALMFELVYRAIMADEKADKALKEAKKAYEEARKAREEAKKAYEEAKKARQEIEDINNKIAKMDKKLDKILDRLDSL